MAQAVNVLEYKCPCCDAPLHFSGVEQKLTCNSCDNEFELDALKDYMEASQQKSEDKITWEEYSAGEWTQQEESEMKAFVCPSCAGEIVSDSVTTAKAPLFYPTGFQEC